MSPPLRSTLLLLVCLAVPSLAQEDRPAGLFTRARQLPLVSESVRMVVANGAATLEVHQVFLNDGSDEGQADFQFRLPVGATVAGFAFWDGDKLLRAELKDKEEARAEHQAAAAEHRTTGLLEVDGAMQKFSVYPLRAGEFKRVVTTLRVPVARELGRSQVRLPLDGFLGEKPMAATVAVDLSTEDALSEVGVDGAAMQLISKAEKHASLVFQAEALADVWWVERGEPLVLSADAVPLDDGTHALQVRIALNDAGPWKTPFSQVHVVVDGSFSMKRRAGAVGTLVARLVAQSSAPVTVHVVAERTVRFSKGDLAAQVVAAINSGAAGFGASLTDLMPVLHHLECHASGVRCIVLTDPELTRDVATEDLRQLDLPSVVLADAFERTWAQGHLPADSRVIDPDVDAPARLASIADQLVLPVLDVHALDGSGLTMSERMERRVAEGGLLRLTAKLDHLTDVRVLGELAGHPFERTLKPTVHEANDATGLAVRRAYFERQLADWLAQYATTHSSELKQAIVTLSLREKIPTPLTSMHVASPELSMADIKPGDPLLVVPFEPGLVEATAWYPFGDWRRLVKDQEGGRWVDRFLVPRGWAERWYAVEVFKRYEDGTVREQKAWYRVDETSPGVAVTIEHDALIVRPADDAKDLSSVLAHLADGRVVTLSPMQGTWRLPLSELTATFALVLRDRAGNRGTLRFGLAAGLVTPEELTTPPRSRSGAGTPVAIDGEGQGLSVHGGVATLHADGATVTFSAPALRSLEVTALLRRGASMLFGTAGGDLVDLRCETRDHCTVGFVGGSRDGHRISGLVESKYGVLVGVLGEGVQRYDRGRLIPSGLRFGSEWVTALGRSGDDVLVGTACNGLWRVVRDGRVLKSRLPVRHVGAIVGQDIWSGSGRFSVRGRDTFVALKGELPVPSRGPVQVTSGVRVGDSLVVGTFDQGIQRAGAAGLVPIEVGLEAMERQVNATLVTADGTLWLGTEGGVLRVDPKTWTVKRLTKRAAHDLAACAGQVVAATEEGLLRTTSGGLERLDTQGVGTGRFTAVACDSTGVFAGGLEGLYHFADHGPATHLGVVHGLDAGWVTALTQHEGHLYVGTYANGVYALRDGQLTHVAGLERQWVTPHGLKSIGGALWVGGLGMNPVREGRPFALPVRDVFDFVPSPTGVTALTSEGPIEVTPTPGS